MGVSIVEKITSTQNPLVKEIAKLSQKKFREENGLFLAEGEKAIKGLFCAGFKIEKLFFTQAVEIDYEEVNVQEKYLVNEAVLSKISTTKTPCNAVAVVKQKKYDISDFLSQKRLLLLENIKDAGNLGTILRSCKAFDINSVLLLGDTIDVYNPKVVRASVGCFDLPVINVDYDDLKKFSHNFYSTALYENSVSLKDVKFEQPFIIAFGSEADGLTKEFLSAVNSKNVKIETSTQVESLNLASAVSICLYEAFKTI